MEEMSIGEMPELLTLSKVGWISSCAIHLTENEEYQAAIMLMNEALDLDSSNPISRTTLAKIYRVLGQYENSYSTLEKGFKEVVKRLGSRFEEYEFYLEVGYASYYLNKKNQAISAFKEALIAITDKSRQAKESENEEFLKKIGTDFQVPEISDEEITELKEIISAVEFQLL